jgi:hypothetical protein
MAISLRLLIGDLNAYVVAINVGRERVHDCMRCSGMVLGTKVPFGSNICNVMGK